MKKSIVLFTVLLIIILINSNFSYAQENTNRSWGISAAVNTSQADIMFPIWAGESNTIVPAIGIVSIGDMNTDVSVGIVFHHYFKYNSNFSPIIGVRMGLISGNPKTGKSTTDYIAGFLGGG